MNHDKHEPKHKITDISRPHTSGSDHHRGFTVQSRPMLGPDRPDHAGRAASAAAMSIPVRRESFVPAELKDVSDTSEAETHDAQSPADPILVPEDKAPAQVEETPVAPTPEPPEPEEPEITPSLEPEKPEAEPVPPTPPTPPAQPPAAPPANTPPPTVTADVPGEEAHSDPQKETEEATKAVKRERELQEYINNKQYFVPIDAERKRSDKVSLGLILVAVLLFVVLFDLMLDSGMILLVQKIPHTHFFSQN